MALKVGRLPFCYRLQNYGVLQLEPGPAYLQFESLYNTSDSLVHHKIRLVNKLSAAFDIVTRERPMAAITVNPREMYPGTRLIKGWVGPINGLDSWRREKDSVSPACGQALYRECYTDCKRYRNGYRNLNFIYYY
jgi:hypothetical protein